MTVILQARMNSQRLPGKVLKEVQGKPLLQYTIDRLRQSLHPLRIVVATSDETSDDPVAAYCRGNEIEVFRGELENVAARYRAVIQHYQLPAFVRVTGDSPLIDSQLIDAGIDSFATGQFDLVTNVYPRSFPKGQSFEVLRAETFLEAVPLMRDAAQREHVTQYFYQNAGNYRIYNVASNTGNFSEENLSVDTADDFERFRQVISDPQRPVMDNNWEEILKLYQKMDQHECAN
ncbi:MAG: NTP transferase domain-containing protein [Candidatus Omnitrophica bacterium]|nr:NTP transferase domain-containing protein [Candidatus Omnitrophota bacterium]